MSGLVKLLIGVFFSYVLAVGGAIAVQAVTGVWWMGFFGLIPGTLLHVYALVNGFTED